MTNKYGKEVMKHFTKPSFMGEMKNPSAVGELGNMKCVLPDEKIFLNGKFEKIENSNKKDFIISHKGIKEKIINKFSRNYNGKIITLKNNMGNISLTSEHLVFAVKLPKRDKYFRTKNKKKLIPSWYHVEDLERRDIILYPIYKEVEDKKFIEFNIPKSKWDFRSKKIPKRIPLNDDFLRLCGYFLAEGHISEGKSRNYITLAFNINEESYISDVQKIVKRLFNLDVVLRRMEDKNTLVIHIYSAGLARFFKKLFNKGAKNKSIPERFMKLPIDKQKSLLEGLWKGDGCINLNRKGPRAGYVTISYQLAQQIKILLLRQKIVPSIYVEKEKIIKGVCHREAYRIHVGQKDSLKKLCDILKTKHFSNSSYEAVGSWFDDDFLYTPITDITNNSYNGEVYNLEVKNSHSFISEAFCLHNCGDIMKIYLKVKDDVIKDISFQTFGCVAAIASSDVLCELAKGLSLSEAKKITNKMIIDKLGGLPTVKEHCSVLGAGALKKAILNYDEK